jgi:hypothetical protein
MLKTDPIPKVITFDCPCNDITGRHHLIPAIP